MNPQLKEKLKELLTCPVCSTRMKSEVCLCPNGHPVCRPCWNRLELCPQCSAFYRVPIDSDGKVGLLKCPLTHRTTNRACAYDEVTKDFKEYHAVFGNGQLCKTFCWYTNEILYPVGGVLISGSEYRNRCSQVVPTAYAMVTDFMNLGNQLLEATNGTSDARQQPSSSHHEDCIWRRVSCPEPLCDWVGPVHTLSAHILETASNTSAVGHGTIVQLDDTQMGAFEVPLPLQTDDQPKLIFIVSKSSAAFVARMNTGTKERLEIAMQHFGLRKDSEKLLCKMRVRSALYNDADLHHLLNIGNDLDELSDLDDVVLPPLNKLQKDGYADKEGMLKIEVVIKEREAAGKEINSVD